MEYLHQRHCGIAMVALMASRNTVTTIMTGLTCGGASPYPCSEMEILVHELLALDRDDVVSRSSDAVLDASVYF